MTNNTDQRGNATAPARNGKGELMVVTNAAGFATICSYSADGNLLVGGPS